MCHISSMLTKKELLDLQFIENRHRLIEVAAFLDRLDRHPGLSDLRAEWFQLALKELQSDQVGRAKRILEVLSDRTEAMPESAPFQGAFGAPSYRPE